MKIEVTLEVSDNRTELVNLSEFDISQEKWEGMNEEDQIQWLHENVINELEEPTWYVEHIEKLKK